MPTFDTRAHEGTLDVGTTPKRRWSAIFLSGVDFCPTYNLHSLRVQLCAEPSCTRPDRLPLLLIANARCTTDDGDLDPLCRRVVHYVMMLKYPRDRAVIRSESNYRLSDLLAAWVIEC